MVKPINDDRYKYQMVRVSFRWVDYCRLKHLFPSEKGESASDYFKRLVQWLKEVSKDE